MLALVRSTIDGHFDVDEALGGLVRLMRGRTCGFFFAAEKYRISTGKRSIAASE